MKCPRCGKPMQFDAALQTMRCTACGFRLFHDDPVPDENGNYRETEEKAPKSKAQTTSAAVKPAASKHAPIAFELPSSLATYKLNTESDYGMVRARSRCVDAMLAVESGDKETARTYLRAVLELDRNFADAWLFLAGLADTADEQREYLEHVISSEPGNGLAMRILAQLDGKAEARHFDPSALAQGRLEPGEVPITRLECPRCGGQLDYDVQDRAVMCRSCGFQMLDADDMARTAQQTTVVEGLLKRKADPLKWNIGRRWLRCEGCGAVTTLTRETLTSTCRFCGSTYVVQEAVDRRFEQPDLIVPFQINRDDAQKAIRHKLGGGFQRIKEFFKADVQGIDVDAAYLPFWSFDADMIVRWHWTNAPDRGEQIEILQDVVYLAVSQPSPSLVEKVEPFDLRRGVDYDPRLLVRYPARLYAVDFDRASIEVRTRLVQLATRKAGPGLRIHRPSDGYGEDNDPGHLEMTAGTRFMTYRLVLLPVWLGRIHREGGEIQAALVNGQTGVAGMD